MATMTATGSGDHDPLSVNFQAATERAAKSFAELAQKTKDLEAAVKAVNGDSTFEQQLRQLAQERPALLLSEAIRLIDSGAHAAGLDGSTLRQRAEWVLSQPDIMELLGDRKINAIKEVRARTYLGLKEAKDAVEYAQQLKAEGWLSPAEQEKLEEEAREAIASIARVAVPRCSKCGHVPHEPGACYNLASDNDCDC